MTTMRSANLTLRKGTVTTSTKTAATNTTLTGVGTARNESRTWSSRSRAVRVAGRGPSLGRMLLPRAHPCIAHYRPFPGAHNRTSPANDRVHPPRVTGGERPEGGRRQPFRMLLLTWRGREAADGRLEGASGAQAGGVVIVAPDDHEPHGQPVGQPGRHGGRRMPADVERSGVDDHLGGAGDALFPA